MSPSVLHLLLYIHGCTYAVRKTASATISLLGGYYGVLLDNATYA